MTLARYRKLWGTVATLVVGWVTLKLGLDLDPDLAALISGTLAAIALERLPNAPKLDQ